MTVSPDFEKTVAVAVPIPAGGLFSYKLPAELQDKAKPGMRVRVPFKNQETTGTLIRFEESGAAGGVSRLKPVLEILDDEPALSESMLKLTKRVSDHYACSWGEAIENALPAWVKSGTRAKRDAARQAEESSAADPYTAADDFDLTPEQSAALGKIEGEMDRPHPQPVLLYGVTGSGKSEIYIRAIRRALDRGRNAICLVPEIALTEQLERFFSARLGRELEILHSKMSDTERYRAWKRLRSGQRRVVLGPRSAIFSPLENVGLIVVDEEHEGSYKQETTPRYHARDVARWRAEIEGALCLAGTATPSLEAMHACDRGETIRLDLKERVSGRLMPQVRILDLKRERSMGNRRPAILSTVLAREIQNNLDRREGTLILLNRRGFSTQIQCLQCGQIETCPSCQVSLTYHQELNSLVCHYCGIRRTTRVCSRCQSPSLKFTGFGTEKVESELGRWFPQSVIARLDADTTSRKGSHEQILADFRSGKTQILIGTQMIAKGFDFPNVTLVGVILADVGLMLPDFRSSERTFQLLTQVAGRAGRGEKQGRVLIQTFSPEHPSIVCAKTHDYSTFYRQEIEQRRELQYPPFKRLVNVIVRSKDEKKTYLAARGLRDALKKNFAADTAVEIIGPAPLPFFKLRGYFRWHVMLKIPLDWTGTSELAGLIASFKKPSAVAIAVDIDCLNVL